MIDVSLAWAKVGKLPGRKTKNPTINQLHETKEGAIDPWKKFWDEIVSTKAKSYMKEYIQQRIAA